MKIVLLESLGISDEILQSYAEALEKEGHRFTAYERTEDTARQIEEAKDADIIIIANMPLKGEIIKACPDLKYIDVAFTGVDHVDLEAAKGKGIKVSNASGYSTVAVAELTIAMMLNLLRNVRAVEDACRNGGTKSGLVGFSKKDDTDLITYLPIKELMEQADIVSLHCPVTDQSRNIINAKTLAYMKPTAYLINEARGPVVDSRALADALNSGKIAGAGIDVFETEPPLNTAHPLLHAKNTIVTPHVAFATRESMRKRAAIVFDNIHTFLAGNQQNIIL